MGWLRRCWGKHSLTIVLVGIYLIFQTVNWFTAGNEQHEWLHSVSAGHADDTWGAILIVLGTKWWHEWGSPQDKDFQK